MSELDAKLAAIEKILQKYPDASVRVKFPNSVIYRHFPDDNVRYDSSCDSDDNRAVQGRDNFKECDSDATVVAFSEWFKNNALQESATVATVVTTPVARVGDIATAERQTRTPLGVRLYASDAPTVDWADLSEKEFEKALLKIKSVEELNGVANRRRVLRHDFKKWSEVQTSLILHRKFILENENG